MNLWWSAKFRESSESFEVPQVCKSMVIGVVDQKMPGCGNCAGLFRPGRDLRTNQTETGFDAELV